MKGLDKLHDGADVEAVLEEVITARRAGTDPKELFGGPRDWVDGALPPIAFVLGNLIGGLSAGIWAAVAVEVVVVAIRLARRETLRHAFSGAFGVLISVGIAKWTGSAKNFFLPGILINAAYAIVFLVSIAAKHPLVGVIMRVVYEKPAAWHDHPRVKRAYAEATVGWALVFGLRAVVQEALREMDKTGLLAVAKISMGWPLYLGALALTVPYVKRRTAGVPEPSEEPGETEPESGGDDTAAETA